MKIMNNKGYVLTEVLVVTVFVMAAFLAIYVNYYPMLGEYDRRISYTNLEPKYSLFYMKQVYLTSYENGEKIIEAFRADNNLKYINLLKTENNSLVCKSEYVDDVSLCNSLIERHGIKRLIVTEYNIDDVKNVSIDDKFDKYIDYLPSYKYVNDKKLFRLTIQTNDGYATTEFDLMRLRKSLYAVLEDAAYEGTYAKKYTGSHQDSMDPNDSIKDIYYWYGSNATNGTAILNKNNVIFANHCWQMIRTTDTGGVRMIYNGEVEDGKCLNTRGTHVGYGGNRSSQSLNGTYWYGTDYTYSNGTFSLSETTSSTQVTSSNGSTVIPTLVGKYTCKSTTESGTCSTLYLIESYNSSYNAYTIPINSSSDYSQFGTLQFNATYNSPAYVGYMYNTVYPVTGKSKTYSIANSSASISPSNYYSDTISYDSTTNKYTLVNPQLMSSLSDYSDLVGKYTTNNNSASASTHCYYITGISGTSLKMRQLVGEDLATSLMIGDSYTDNGNGTYTVNNATSVTYIDWYNSTSTTLATYKGKYVCVGTSATCTNLMHIATSQNPFDTHFYYFGTEHSYKYSESVSYSNGTYTLTGDIKTIWDIYDGTELAKINTHHYTCLSTSTSCTTVSYANIQNGVSMYYMSLTGVNDIETALTNMLSSNNVNANNSTMKFGIDAWYKKYLLPYDSYIDDTIYCNDRSIRSLGGFNPNGGGITNSSSNYLQFKEYDVGTDLSCTNVTDKFSVSNSSAQLTYKVGLMSSPEMNLLNQNNARKTGQYYWLVSPYGFSLYYASGRRVYSGGSWGYNYVYLAHGMRPAISLAYGTRYTSGDGSMANPYVVLTEAQ